MAAGGSVMDWLNTSDSGQGVARPANRYSKAKSLGVDTQAEDTCKEPTQPLTSLLHRILDARAERGGNREGARLARQRRQFRIARPLAGCTKEYERKKGHR